MQISMGRHAGPLAGRRCRRATRLAGLLCGLLVGLVGGGLPAGATPPAAADPTPSSSVDSARVKYYVVGSGGATGREYLFQIAARTLGDGRRYREIFELNKGRPQPDGGRLDDPTVLVRGWILILPDDAEGPGVLIGAPPVFGSSAAAPSPAATPSGAADGMVRAAALVLVTIVLAGALHLLRRGRRIDFPVPSHADTKNEPETRNQKETKNPEPDDKHPPQPSAPASSAAPPSPESPQVPPPDPTSTIADATIGEATIGEATIGEATIVEAIVSSGEDQLTVRLIGARPGAGDAYCGRGEARSQRADAADVRLGDGPDALWVDLTACPDVVRITGTRAGVRRQSEQLVRQLGVAGVPTAVVGDVPGVTDVAGRAASSVGELTGDSPQVPLLVAFMTEPTPADMTVLNGLITSLRPRVVPVVVGAGPRSRWSIEVA